MRYCGDRNGTYLRLIAFLLAAVLVKAASAQPQSSTSSRGVQDATSPAPAVQLGPFYALVIGNNNYAYLPKLQTAINDADAVARLLHDQYGFATQVLHNATRNTILTAMNNYRRTLPENSNLLIYYAGHGHHDLDADKAYWLPVDAQADNNDNWVSADDITADVRALPSLHVLIISDSCYSGALTRSADVAINPSERSSYMAKMVKSKSRDLMSSGADEPVADGGAAGHSVFAGALLASLREMNPDEFTAAELFQRFVQPAVAGGSDQLPQYSPIRNSGHAYGDFIFLRQPGVQAAGLVVPAVDSSGTVELSQKTGPGTRQTSVVAANLRPKEEQPSSPTERSAAPPDPLSPQDPGIYYLESTGSQRRLVRLQPAPASRANTKAGASSGFGANRPRLVGKPKPDLVVVGSTAQIRVAEPRPTFYFYFRSSNPSSSSLNPAFQTASSPTEFILAHVDSKKDEREVPMEGSSVRPKDAVPFSLDEVATGIYKVQLRNDVQPGEYGFLFAGANDGTGPQWLYDFGVDNGR